MAPLDWSGEGLAWSPDGTRIVAATLPMVGGQVRIVEVATGNAVHVACGQLPSWWDRRHILIEGLDRICGARR